RPQPGGIRMSGSGAVSMTPFTVAVEQSVLDDLGARLERVRWPTAPRDAGWSYGTNPNYMKLLVEYWRTAYDWRAWERRINAFEQHLVTIDDQVIHDLVDRAAEPKALSLVLTHGWPGSIIEFLEIAPMLAHPERFGGAGKDAFTVVMPSLPGYGFSGPPAEPVSPQALAPIGHRLMRDALGFSHYVAHGSDWGAVVTSHLGLQQPDGLRAIHLTGGALSAAWKLAGQPPTQEEAAYLEALRRKTEGETGYQAVQGTRPMTLSYGLTDSPVGLAAWIVEKYRAWTDREGDDPPFALDTLIAIIMLHWLPGPGPPTWMYRFLLDGSALALPEGETVETPTGICSFPQDYGPPAPESWIRRSYNLQHRTIASGGGHFPGLERGAELVADLRRFFAAYR
ncbi:MAG: epoxide hydrolase family protein, partial [Caulobacter sp.]